MSNEMIAGGAIEKALIAGDLSGLSETERMSYYGHVCASLGLNPLTKPFEYIRLNGKLTLYARRDCTDQLRSVKGVSLTIASREMTGDVFVVTARATLPNGRTDESIGAVPIKGLSGDTLANALMKAETKAKRRVTLSICGMGLMDETEAATVGVTIVESPVVALPAPPASPSPTPREPERQTAPSVSAAPATPTPVPQGPPGTIERVKDTPFQKAKRKAKEAEPLTKQDVQTIVQQEAVRPETDKERTARMNADAEKVFGDGKGAVVFTSKSGDNAPASPMEWRRCAIVAKERGLDDNTRRTLCMSKVAEIRGVTVESLGSWEQVKDTVTMEEIEQVTSWFRKGV